MALEAASSGPHMLEGYVSERYYTSPPTLVNIESFACLFHVLLAHVLEQWHVEVH